MKRQFMRTFLMVSMPGLGARLNLSFLCSGQLCAMGNLDDGTLYPRLYALLSTVPNVWSKSLGY